MKDKNNVVTHTKFTGISLCGGIGMLDTGLNLALGGKFRPLLHVEREAFCAANLAWQMEKKFLDEAAEWDDVRTITSAECRAYVRAALGGRKLDFIIGGIPCQPFSHAGKRVGGNDERDLWPAALEAIEVYEPSFVFIENVEGMASHVDGARRLLQNLEGAGYRAKAGLFSSKECGASHGRKRWFFLGIVDNNKCERESISNQPSDWREDSDANRPSKIVADTTFQFNDGAGKEWKNWWREPSNNGLRLADAAIGKFQDAGRRTKRRDGLRQDCENVADAKCQQYQRRGESTDMGGAAGEVESAEDERQWNGRAVGDSGFDLPRYAPTRNDFRAWAAVAEMDAARMPAIESKIRGVDYGMANWDLQLHAIGNGVDPLVAAYAFCTLWACMQED